jgi:hypothetical protein
MKRPKLKKEVIIDPGCGIHELPAEWRDKFKERVYSSCLLNGRAIRAAGFPVDTVEIELLRSDDMKASTQLGWTLEDQARATKRPRLRA